MNPTLVRAGFDTVEYAVYGKVPEKFLLLLAEGKKKALETRNPFPMKIEGIAILVQPSGGQGGFSYLISTGPYGATIKFREIGSQDPFCAHIKLSAYGLATKGLNCLKSECDDFFERIKSVTNSENTRIGRLDYALDFFAPELVVDADQFVTHAKRSKSEVIERRTSGDRVSYLRIGSMPRLQLCVYDKLGQTKEKADLVWQDIFSKALRSSVTSSGTSSWWRVEFRLGKEALDKFANPRLWGPMMALSGTAFRTASEQISWKQPSEDSNRSRWPLHAIWQITRQHLECGFESFPPTEISEATKRQIAQNYLAGLEAQCDGLVLTIAAAYDVEPNSLTDFVRRHFGDMAKRLSERVDLEDQLTTRRERQLILGRM